MGADAGWNGDRAILPIQVLQVRVGMYATPTMQVLPRRFILLLNFTLRIDVHERRRWAVQNAQASPRMV